MVTDNEIHERFSVNFLFGQRKRRQIADTEELPNVQEEEEEEEEGEDEEEDDDEEEEEAPDDKNTRKNTSKSK